MSTTETTVTTTTTTAAAVRKFEEDAKHGRLSTKDFGLIKTLGKGGGGVVLHVKHVESGVEIALKCVLDDFGGEEAEIHRQVSSAGDGHPNILHLYGSYRAEETGTVCIMLEYCPQGTVMDVMTNAVSNGVWDEEPKEESQLGKSKNEFLAKVAVGILQAMKHMERQDVLHSDIKPLNILWKDGNAKLGDFGLATQLASSSSSSFSSNHTCRSKNLFGTVPYMAPEVLALVRGLTLRKKSQQHESFGYSHKAELWSLGVSIFELAFGRYPFPYKPDDSKTLADNVCMYMEQNKYFSSRCIQFLKDDAPSDDLKNLILALLRTNPDKRLSIDEALQHPWILRHTSNHELQHPPRPSTTANTNHHGQLDTTEDQENTAQVKVDGKTSSKTKSRGSSDDERIKNDDDTSTLGHALQGLDLNSP